MSSEQAVGLSRGAFASLAIFAILLGLVLVTREDRVEVGVQKLELAKLDRGQVTRIELTGKDAVVLEKNGDAFEVFDPKAPATRFAAEKSAVESALAALDKLEVGTFITGRAEKHAELEVDNEKGLAVKVTAGPVVWDLVLGRSGKGGGNYLRLAGIDKVFVSKGALTASLKKDVNGWRKRKIVDLSAEDVSALTVELPGETPYRVEQTEGATWRFADDVAVPADFRVDAAAIGRQVSSLVGLRAVDFADAPGADTGLKTGAKITASSRQGQPIVLHLGKENDKKQVFVNVEGEPQVYLIAAYASASLQKRPTDFRDLTVLPLRADDVQKVVIRTPKETVELQKGADAWQLASPAPADFEFDAAGVSNKLSSLFRMRGSALISPAPADDAAGLSSPAVEWVFTLQNGEERRISFGGPVPAEGSVNATEVYVQGEGGLVYRIGQFQKSRYEKPWELFRQVQAPPMPPGGMGGMGGMGGLDQLPPEIRQQLEQAMRQQGR